MATPQVVRRWILSGAVTAITVTGSIYGAGLKEDMQAREKRRQAETTPEDVIAQLEQTRSDLVSKKNELERRIATFRIRRQEEEQGIKPENKGR
ncbi:hypothetical protein P280DRAFT_519351 [Massarina eburnea CBS 473.64]|uniref:Uncharacterized protein n=1 Tax=Massarina eburnea CBS 473.64 TaxID=1395130 RepID=A0A6A6RVG1_9PLEO|nr:hypothetical protein P280DRAFT_519351 [Massarina eburnea CBS 473.64]